MGRKAKPENCEHPFKSLERIALGRYKCGRCDTDLTDPARKFEWRHSERITLEHGDRLAITGAHHSGPFQAIFLWAQEFPSGVHYVVAEVQQWRHEGKVREDWAAIRHVKPEHVKRAPGYRDRKAREELGQ